MNASGDIKNMSVPWFFQDIRTGKKTGTAVLSRDKEIKKVYFKAGEIIYASSNLEADQLGYSLLRAGKLNEEQHIASEEAARQTGKQLGAVLIERGLVTPKDLVEGAKLQVRQIVFSLYRWRDGYYKFEGGPLPMTEIVPLQMGTGSLLMEGMRGLEWKIVRRSLPPLNTVLRPAKDTMALLDGIELDRDQETIFSFVDGNRNIEEICALSEIGDFSTLKALYVLLALRLAESFGIKTESTQPAADVKDKQHIAVKVTRELILQVLDTQTSQDYYQMLDVGRNATTQEIKKAYFRLAKMYHPDRHVDTEFSDMKEKLEAIFMAITEAYDTLTQEDTRDAYNLSLVSGINQQRTVDQKQSHQEDSKKRSAADQFNEGLNHYRGQNFWGAEESFRWAVRLDPSNAEYLFHQGLALAHMPRRLHDAAELLEKAISMAPSKIDYYIELGNLYSRNGLKKKAQNVFQDALKRYPNSDKVKQAIRNLGG
jgi:curved DNA-binding protein CbpA